CEELEKAQAADPMKARKGYVSAKAKTAKDNI
nr:hypothetical protein [Tanacetum cinerariifolium]